MMVKYSARTARVVLENSRGQARIAVAAILWFLRFLCVKQMLK